MPVTPLQALLISIVDTIEPIYYRLRSFFLMSILEDPAMLAFAFC